MKCLTIAVAIMLIPALPVYGQGDVQTARAELFDPSGKSVGTVSLEETPHGVLLNAKLRGMPPGVHAFHLHSVGRCEPPFKSAGGHFNPFGRQHGLLNPQGLHAGDLPNIHVGEGGALSFEALAGLVTLGAGENSLFDADGSAIVIHEGPDDYRSDPAGAAGKRIACGVILK